MLTFNNVLNSYGYDPNDFLLIRHTIVHLKTYDWWKTNLPVTTHSVSGIPQTFEEYQQAQVASEFGTNELAPKYWASFIGTPNGTMFIGIYRRNGPPFSHPANAGEIMIPLVLDTGMTGLRGKLFINGTNPISWAQFAKGKKYEVIEIRKTENNSFPSWRNFSSTLPALETLWENWREVLTNLTGIYLLSAPLTGEPLYVGQADGHGGFLDRWEEYARNGHGGNVAMKSLPRTDYAVRILELGSDDELDAKEKRWKSILGTRVGTLGLNRN